MFRRALILAAAVMLTVTPVYAETCHGLVISYLEHDQDPKNPGERIKNGSNNEPVLMATTAYYEGNIGSHGDVMREGYAACAPEMYGDAVVVYEAVLQENGSYRIGDYLATFEIRDCGYGYSTGEGKSEIRSDKKYAGTIETGIHLDIWRENLTRCREWMEKTNGYCFAVIVAGKG